MAWLEILPLVFKLLLYFLEKTKDQPQEQRRKLLSDFDQAIERAKNGDPRRLSEWLGRNL